MHTVKDNAVLPILKKMVYRHTPIVNDKAADQMTTENVSQLNIVTSGIKKTISELSGGNQQKVVLAKWLNMKPRIMMLDEPTAGVDIGAKSEIIDIIRKFADEGNAVLFVSSELTELMAVCDRIITLFDGRITGEIARRDIPVSYTHLDVYRRQAQNRVIDVTDLDIQCIDVILVGLSLFFPADGQKIPELVEDGEGHVVGD